jgi:hypothetical protein
LPGGSASRVRVTSSARPWSEKNAAWSLTSSSRNPYAFLSMLGSWKDLACRRGVEKKISRKAGN